MWRHGLTTARRWAGGGSLAVIAALALYACGSSSSAPPSSGSSSSSSPSGVTATSGSSSASSGSATATAAAGKQIFDSAGCAACHTLAADHATATIGPDLDTLKPSYTAVVDQVTHGGGGMPSFSTSLSQTQIASVAKFVVAATH